MDTKSNSQENEKPTSSHQLDEADKFYLKNNDFHEVNLRQNDSNDCVLSCTKEQNKFADHVNNIAVDHATGGVVSNAANSAMDSTVDIAANYVNQAAACASSSDIPDLYRILVGSSQPEKNDDSSDEDYKSIDNESIDANSGVLNSGNALGYDTDRPDLNPQNMDVLGQAMNLELSSLSLSPSQASALLCSSSDNIDNELDRCSELSTSFIFKNDFSDGSSHF